MKNDAVIATCLGMTAKQADVRSIPTIIQSECLPVVLHTAYGNGRVRRERTVAILYLFRQSNVELCSLSSCQPRTDERVQFESQPPF